MQNKPKMDQLPDACRAMQEQLPPRMNFEQAEKGVEKSLDNIKQPPRFDFEQAEKGVEGSLDNIKQLRKMMGQMKLSWSQCGQECHLLKRQLYMLLGNLEDRLKVAGMYVKFQSSKFKHNIIGVVQPHSLSRIHWYLESLYGVCFAVIDSVKYFINNFVKQSLIELWIILKKFSNSLESYAKALIKPILQWVKNETGSLELQELCQHIYSKPSQNNHSNYSPPQDIIPANNPPHNDALRKKQWLKKAIRLTKKAIKKVRSQQPGLP